MKQWTKIVLLLSIFLTFFTSWYTYVHFAGFYQKITISSISTWNLYRPVDSKEIDSEINKQIDNKIDFEKSSEAYAAVSESFNHENGISTTEVPLIAEAEAESNLTCQVPLIYDFDPFRPIDSTFRSMTLTCDVTQPFLSFVDEFNYLQINQTEFVRLNSINNSQSIFCSYRQFERKQGPNDNAIDYEASHLLLPNISVPLTKDFVEVTCSNAEYDVEIYSQSHAIVANRSSQSEFDKETEDRLSVVVLLIDSVSHAMVARDTPKTYKFLRETMNSYFLRGYNKVGDNSVPNLMPLLTGKRYQGFGKFMPEELPTYYSEHHDKWPIIWTDYRKKKYVTFISEEMPQLSSFHYLGAPGFAKKPAEHSYRPWWLKTYNVKGVAQLEDLCYANRPRILHQLDIMKRMFRQYKNTLKFGYFLMNDVVHDFANRLGIIDEHLYEFLEEAYSKGWFNNTVFVMLADHGPRFSGTGQKVEGVEPYLPLLMFSFPNWFLKKHRHTAKALQANQHKLAANFDVHETLLDILNSNYNGSQRPYKSRALSLLYDVPKSRSCDDAGIPQVYCTCLKYEAIDSKDQAVQEAAGHVIKEINSRILRNSSHLCATLSLSKVVSAETVVGIPISSKVSRFLRITLEAQPSMSIFQATVSIGQINNSEIQSEINNQSMPMLSLHGGTENILRLNMYRNQPHCLPASPNSAALKPFCYCHKQLER